MEEQAQIYLKLLDERDRIEKAPRMADMVHQLHDLTQALLIVQEGGGSAGRQQEPESPGHSHNATSVPQFDPETLFMLQR